MSALLRKRVKKTEIEIISGQEKETTDLTEMAKKCVRLIGMAAVTYNTAMVRGMVMLMLMTVTVTQVMMMTMTVTQMMVTVTMVTMMVTQMMVMVVTTTSMV